MAFSIFGKKKKKKSDIDEAFDRVALKFQEMENINDPKKLERYILDSCEQIVRTTREIESERREYRVVTDYLKDIETMNNLPDDGSKELRETAQKVVELERSRLSYQNAPKRLDEEVYRKMVDEEEDLPGIIERMQKNEVYQERLRRDMETLEAEKNEMEIERDICDSNQRVIRILSIMLMVTFVMLVILVFLLERLTDINPTGIFLGVFLVGVIASMGIFSKNQSNRRTRRRATRRLNEIITMLNVIRMKFANVTKAINFTCEHFDVRTSSELAYLFEQYELSVRERELYRRNNDDLDYYSGKLEHLLSKANLYDAKMWLSRVDALASKNEMVETTHRLNERRRKIRTQIEENTNTVQMERDEIDRLMKEHQYYVPEVIEIIQSVDRICGLNQYKRRK